MPFDPLVRHLLNGKKLQHRIIQANRRPLFLQSVPVSIFPAQAAASDDGEQGMRPKAPRPKKPNQWAV
jgi:hypothetical protein